MTADNSAVVFDNEPEVACKTGFSKKNVDIVKAGMRRVVTNGACRYNFGKLDIAVACKTGTSQVEKTINGSTAIYNNGFNISFAPYDDPEIAVAVAIEGALSGSSCAPVACDVYNYYFNNSVDDENENVEKEEINSSLLR